MLPVSKLLKIHEDFADRQGLNGLLGDPVLIEYCQPYATLRRAMDEDQDDDRRILELKESSEHIGLGWPLHRIQQSGNSHRLPYTNNYSPLKELLGSIRGDHRQFTNRNYDYKDILGNTVIAEYVVKCVANALRESASEVPKASELILSWCYVYLTEFWIGLYCRSELTQWFAGLNLYFRNLSHVSEKVDFSLEGIRFSEFLDFHLYEIVKILYSNHSGQDRGEISPLLQTSLDLTGQQLLRVCSFILDAHQILPSEVQAILETVIETSDSQSFRSSYGFLA